MHKLRYLAPLAAVAVIGTANANGWTVAADTSSVGFTAEQQGGKFNGKFTSFTATIEFDPTAPADGSVVGVVETESVDTRDYDRDAALVDADWFDPANHPEATFESTSIEAAGDGTFVAHGNLTIKGKTLPTDMTFSFDQSGDSAEFEGTMAINRFDFNVGQGWNDTYMVGKDVEVTISLDLSR
ncbi:MAG TPA: YceI family protein [Gammaproteobacteria bacterium]|jgi:polyisoprenoid-binding protein YceI